MRRPKKKQAGKEITKAPRSKVFQRRAKSPPGGYLSPFHLLVENAKDYAISMLDPDGRVTSWNVGAERLTGYRADEIIGKHFSCFYLADDIQRGKPELVLKNATAEGRYEDQSWRVRKDGSRFFGNVIITALRNKEGKLTGFAQITHDLTEVRFAQTARGVFESFPDPILVIDRHGRITQMNAQLASIFGYSREELKDKPVEVLIPQRFRERHVKHVASYIADPHTRPMGVGLELFGRRKDKSEFPVDIMLSSMDTDNDSMVIAVVRDITAPKQAAESIRKTNDELLALVTELQRRDSEMQSLISMDDLLQSCTTQEEAYKVVALVAGELFDGQTGCLAVLRAWDQHLEIVARWGDDGPLGEPIFSVDDCWALRRGQLHEVADSQAGLLCRHFVDQPATGYLCVPLTVQGEMLGVFCLVGAPAKRSSHQVSQLQLAVTVSEAVKLSLSNLKLREKLRAEAIHDPLTGLFNRRYLEETLARELHRARRRNSPLCVAMLDLDNFKRFNDTFGHDAGDSLLRELGRLVCGKVRKSDIPCRYGGEEFVLVLPDSSLADAEHRVEQIRVLIKELQIPHGDQLLGALTVSAGVAQADEHSANPSELLRAADQALYAAKNAGRDRVIVYQAEESVRNG
jgi:diguanylate cyclase (GGDEF)-like protein/PAS domain S-box-containing protein